MCVINFSCQEIENRCCGPNGRCNSKCVHITNYYVGSIWLTYGKFEEFLLVLTTNEKQKCFLPPDRTSRICHNLHHHYQLFCSLIFFLLFFCFFFDFYSPSSLIALADCLMFRVQMFQYAKQKTKNKMRNTRKFNLLASRLRSMRSQLYDRQKYYNLIGYIKQLQMIVKYEYVNLVCKPRCQLS